MAGAGRSAGNDYPLRTGRIRPPNQRRVLSEDLPVVVEIVDDQDKIEALLPELDKMIGEGLVTMEKVRVIAYRHNSKV